MTIKYTLRGEEQTAEIRDVVGLDKLTEAGQGMWIILNKLRDEGTWFTALYAKKRLIIELFSDVLTDGYDGVDLLYESDFYDELLLAVNQRQLMDIEDMFDSMASEISCRSSFDHLAGNASAILSKWDQNLTESVNLKSLAKLIDRLANIDQRKLIPELVKAITTSKAG